MENESLVNSPPVVPVISPEPVAVIQPEKKKSGLKNLVLLVLALFLIGGGLGAVYLQIANRNPAPAQVQVQNLPPAETKPILSLSLTSPEINTVTDSGKLNVTGVTSPNTPVILMTENDDLILESDDEGNFEGEIELDEGINNLSVSALNEDGEEKSLTREVVFDDQVLGQKTDSGRVLASETRNKKFVEDSLETVIRNNYMDKNIRYVDEKNRLVRSNTINPKDKVLAVLENNDATGTGKLKKAVKIFSRSATSSGELRISKRRAVQGVVTNISGNIIDIAHQIQRDRIYRVIFNPQTVFTATNSANLTSSVVQVGQRIIAVGTASDSGDILATRIRIIPGKATGIFTKKPVTPFPTLSSTPSATPVVTVAPTITPSPTPIPPTPSPTLTPTPTP